MNHLSFFVNIVFSYGSSNQAYVLFSDADKARKHGLDEFVTADPCKYDHADHFKLLQTLTLDYRLNVTYTQLVSHVSVNHGLCRP